MRIERFDEIRKWDPETRTSHVIENQLGTVGQLIEYLQQFDSTTKVAVNVAEEPSEIIDIQERLASDCTGRGDGLTHPLVAAVTT